MGKSSAPTIGYHYRAGYQHGLTIGEIDAFLEFRGGDKTAWQGVLTASGTISVNAPNLWGGEKDQGGIVGDLDVMFGEPTQAVNPYLLSTFGSQTPAWRGFSTVVFKGGRYGAMNPYPQKASYKIQQILQGWDGECWYPEKAKIPIGTTPVPSAELLFPDLALDATIFIGPPFDLPGYPSAGKYYEISGLDPTDVLSITVPGGLTYMAMSRWAHDYDNPDHAWSDGFHVTVSEGGVEGDTEQYLDSFGSFGVPWYHATPEAAAAYAAAQPPSLITGATSYRIHFRDWELNLNRGGVSLRIEKLSQSSTVYAINPAHVLYYSRTNSDMGREPVININEASLLAAADKLYAEGFGICPKWNPAAESVEEFEQRICRLIGGSFTRSLEDGQWYLDLARPDYVLEDLPILTDDDILDFKEQPSTLDSATNSVSVRYFDPQKKETIVTPPVRALGLVAAFGTIHQTNDYPEIPTDALAARVALRDMLSTATPTRVFDLVTTRRTYAWRPNQYFRLQSTKRGIADMVCIVGERQSGTLKSGAIRMKATQDIYSLPTTSFVEVEPGVDTRPPQVPTAITLQRAFEAPYVEVAGAMPRAELQALPEEVGFAMAVAVQPAEDINYTMMVSTDAGSTYDEAGQGEWCATATTVSDTNRTETDLTLASSNRLDQVAVGMAVLWDEEICRVDAIDADALTISLGRGCADTTPANHGSGTRLWFYPVGFAYDFTEYTDGETIDIKLLSNTGSQRLPLGSATAMSVAFDQRAFRPYPPARIRINTQAAPSALDGELIAAWVYRDRLLQADQLVDNEAAGIGPEAGTTVNIYWYLNNVLAQTHTGISGTSQAYTPVGDGTVRVEIESERDGVTSWQRQVREFAYTTTPPFTRVTTTGDVRVTTTGDTRITG